MRVTPTMRRSAIHEAGHAALADRFGWPLSSVWIVDHPARGEQQLGQTQLEVSWLLDRIREGGLPTEQKVLMDLAGDAAEGRPGLHFLATAAELGEEEARRLWAIAKQLVTEERPRIDRLAAIILASDGFASYGQDIHDALSG